MLEVFAKKFAESSHNRRIIFKKIRCPSARLFLLGQQKSVLFFVVEFSKISEAIPGY